MHDVNPAALRAGLIDTVTDVPFCVMWLGGAYSVRKFLNVFLQHKIAKQIVMFSGGSIYLDHEAGYTAEEWYQWILTRLRDQTSVARRAYDEKLQSAERSRKARKQTHADSSHNSGSLAGLTHMAVIPTHTPTEDPMEAPVAVGAKRSFRVPSR